MRIRSMAVFGDSILKGVVYDSVAAKYRIGKDSAFDIMTERLPGIRLTNYSRFGSTAPKGRAAFAGLVEKGEQPDAVLIEFGGNDCDYDWAEVSAAYKTSHDPHTPLPKYEETLRRFVALARSCGIIPVMMTLPPISADRYFDFFTRADNVDSINVLHWLVEKQVIYRTQENYSHRAGMIANELDVDLIDARSPFLLKRNLGDYLCEDGIHLNANGQKLLGETIVEEIKKRFT